MEISGLSLIVKDTEGSQIKTAEAFKECASVPDCLAVIGPAGREEVSAVASLSSSSNIPVVHIFPGKKTAEKSNFLFSIRPAADDLMDALLDYAESDLNLKIRYGIFPVSKFGENLKDVFISYYKKHGESFPEVLEWDEKKDFNKKITVFAKNPGIKEFTGIYLGFTPDKVIKISEILFYYDVETFIFATDLFCLSAVERADDIFFASSGSCENSNEKLDEFARNFRDLFGFKPSIFEAAAYDSASLIAWTFIKTKNEQNMTRENMIKNLKQVTKFEGVSGIFSCGENGCLHEVHVYQIKKGRIQMVK
jgi:ABC-type branched-subunit amino acid transport system substrate-binding protein